MKKKKKRLELEDLKARIDVVKNSDVPMEFNKDGITIYSPEAIELMSRAGHRLANQELKKQVNIENTLYETKNILEKEKENGQDVASSEPVKDDFMTQFYNGVGEISDVDMQLLWAKLLACEIKQPHSFSLRTLSKLKMMTTNEAKLFEKVLPYIIESEYIIRDETRLNKYGIKYMDLLVLQDCGIINLEGATRIYTQNATISYKNLICTINKKVNTQKDQNVDIRINCYLLTNFGKELLKIVTKSHNIQFFIDFAKDLKEKNADKFFISCFELDNDSINNTVVKLENDLLA